MIHDARGSDASAVIDGVMQAPGGPTEDTSGGCAHGGRVFPCADEDFGKIMAEIFAKAEAFLPGPTTWETFGSGTIRTGSFELPER